MPAFAGMAERSLCLKHALSGIAAASDFHDSEVGH
jgi:hypothetical protein